MNCWKNIGDYFYDLESRKFLGPKEQQQKRNKE